MRGILRILGGLLVAGLVFFVLAVPALWWRAYPLYALYLGAEKLGLLTRGAVGAMQILGRYFHGPPGWVRSGVEALTAAILFAPALGAALFAYQRIALGPRVTRCGNCRHVLKGLTEPRCPRCGQGL